MRAGNGKDIGARTCVANEWPACANMRDMDRKPRIASVTVAFNPPPARVADQVHALRAQVDEIFIVDNGSTQAIGQALRALESGADPKVSVTRLPDNAGVGTGFNEGVRRALQGPSEYVLLLDHDSMPTPGMVAELVAAYSAASEHGPVAAVGPKIRDSRDGHEYPFVRLGWTHNPKLRCIGAKATIPCDFLISSGSLISREALARVGLLDPQLFVDYIDLDWCCRAKAKGFSLHGVCGAMLRHELGEDPRRVLGGVRIVVHPPERTYYLLRNRLLLYQRAYIPLKWKLKDVARATLKLVSTVLFVPPRAQHLRMAVLAVRDGLRRRGGPLATAHRTRA